MRGFLPAHVLSMEEQVARVLTNLRSLPNDLEKYIALNSLHDRNEALFFRVVCDNIDEIQPLIYTPTVGLACQRFGLIFQRPRGSSSRSASVNAVPLLSSGSRNNARPRGESTCFELGRARTGTLIIVSPRGGLF